MYLQALHGCASWGAGGSLGLMNEFLLPSGMCTEGGIPLPGGSELPPDQRLRLEGAVALGAGGGGMVVWGELADFSFGGERKSRCPECLQETCSVGSASVAGHDLGLLLPPGGRRGGSGPSALTP